jgi:hypothetical protein
MLVKILKNKLNKVDRNLEDLFNNFKNDKKFLFLFYLNFTIQIITLTILPISLSGDSFQYLAIADRINIFNLRQFFNTNLEDRSLGYPLFLYLSLTKTFIGITLVIFLQSLAAIFIPLIIYKTFKKYHENASFFVSIVFSVYIYKLYTSIQIMTEILFMLFISILFLLFLKFINKKNIKNFIFLTLNVLILSLIRPSGQLFFYLLLILLIIYFINKEIKFLENLKLLFILIIGLVIFKVQHTPAAKNMPYFMAWYEVSTAFCDIKDSHKINNIRKSQNALVPDDRFYLMIQKDKKNFNEIDKIYLYKEKCLNFSILNVEKKNYLDTLSKLIDKDLITANTLKSTYDIKGSPDKIDPDLANLNSVDLIKRIHEKYIFPLPFQHIFWRLSAHIGRDKTTQLLNAVSLKTMIDRPEIFFNRTKKVINEITFSSQEAKSLIANIFLNISGMDMYFWRFVPSVYESIEEQNLTLLYKVNPKIYLQHLYNLEILIGSDINKIYSKSKKPWEIAEEDFYKNNNPLEYLLKDRNIAKTATMSFMVLNYYMLILIKFLITFIFPFYIIFILLRIIYKKILKKKKIISDLELTALFFSLFSYVSIFISLMLVLDPRHILMHFIGFSPLILLIIKNFYIKKKKI